MKSEIGIERKEELRRFSKKDLVSLVLELEDRTRHLEMSVTAANRKTSIFQTLLNDGNPTDFIGEFFLSLPVKESSIARGIFFKTDAFVDGAVYGTGPKYEDFAYLDEQIDNLLGGKSTLHIPDTSKIHSLQFQPDAAYPRSVIAFPIILGDSKVGYIWIGDENYSAYSEKEVGSLRKEILEKQLSLSAAHKLQKVFEEKTLYETAFNLISMPVVILSRDGNLVFANKTAKNNFRISQTESGELSFENLELISHLFRDGGEVNDKNGDVYEITSEQLPFDGRNDYRVILLENKTLNRRKSQHISIIIKSLENSLITPFKEIQGYAALIASLGSLSEKQLEYTIKIREKSENCRRIIHTLTKIDDLSGTKLLDINEVMIQEIFESVISVLNPLIVQKRIEIEEDFSQSTGKIMTDPGLCEQIIITVLDRAIRETPIGGIIEIGGRDITSGYQISIKDSGKGIPKPDLDKIIANVPAEETSYTDLKFIYDVMKFLQGKVTIESNPGAGSTIKLEFPAEI